MDRVDPSSSSFAARSVGPVVFVVWRGVVTPEAVEGVGALLHRTAEQHPDGIAFITIASFHAPIPSAAVRARIIEVYSELGSGLVAVAQVVEGEGFWASAALCFIAGLGLLHRHAHRNKVFGNVDEAADWVDSFALQGAPPQDSLRRCIATRTHELALGTLADAIGEEAPCVA